MSESKFADIRSLVGKIRVLKSGNIVKLQLLGRSGISCVYINNPTDADIKEASNWTKSMIAKQYGIDPSMVDDYQFISDAPERKLSKEALQKMQDAYQEFLKNKK